MTNDRDPRLHRQRDQGEPGDALHEGHPRAARAAGSPLRTSGALNALGVQYAALDILPDPRIREELSGLSGWPTIPQLFVEGELVGGCDIVTEMYETGELAELLGVEQPEEPRPREPSSRAERKAPDRAREPSWTSGGGAAAACGRCALVERLSAALARTRAPGACSAPSPRRRAPASAPRPSARAATRAAPVARPATRDRASGATGVAGSASRAGRAVVEVLEDPVRVVDDLLAVHQHGHPALAGELLDLGPVALEERHAHLVELDPGGAQPARDLAAAADAGRWAPCSGRAWPCRARLADAAQAVLREPAPALSPPRPSPRPATRYCSCCERRERTIRSCSRSRYQPPWPRASPRAGAPSSPARAWPWSSGRSTSGCAASTSGGRERRPARRRPSSPAAAAASPRGTLTGGSMPEMRPRSAKRRSKVKLRPPRM